MFQILKGVLFEIRRPEVVLFSVPERDRDFHLPGRVVDVNDVKAADFGGLEGEYEVTRHSPDPTKENRLLVHARYLGPKRLYWTD